MNTSWPCKYKYTFVHIFSDQNFRKFEQKAKKNAVNIHFLLETLIVEYVAA